ncbi:MAG: hypothetical protein R2856_01960 [Caldilineaceae bacterium]
MTCKHAELNDQIDDSLCLRVDDYTQQTPFLSIAESNDRPQIKW